MTLLHRRDFIKRAAALSGGLAFAGPLNAFAARAARGDPLTSLGYGPLVDKGDLSLPEAFDYSVISKQGDPAFDPMPGSGQRVPTRFDGMAAFAGPDGATILLRNHENNSRRGELIPEEVGVEVDPALRYDSLEVHNGVPVILGGVTKLTIVDRTVVDSRGVLGGTLTNCAGGVTPWGSWITCEERFFNNSNRLHGYIFEVGAGGGAQRAVPIRGAGRFDHEAAAWLDGVLYETEDDPQASFYRYVPNKTPTRAGQLAGGTGLGLGKLFALAAVGKPRLDTRTGTDSATGWAGEPVAVEWVRIDFPEPANNTRAANPPGVRFQAQDKGAAIFARTEGCWEVDGRIYFDCTNGGPAFPQGFGQIWELDPAAGVLTLIYQSSDAEELNRPDNLTPGPAGNLFLCEDTGFSLNPNPTFRLPHIRALTPGGTVFDFARAETNATEFCGACFDPDGSTMYVNQQGHPVGGVPGVTYAIWGPWSATGSE
jgi:secreted PhoX family phosphatase